MSNPYHHALSSVRKWGGTVEDYLPIHDWFDASKEMHGDFRHRALRHHAQGIFECERVFGHTITLTGGRVIPVRWVGEQHVTEDCGFIPSLSDWVKQIQPLPWMNKPSKLSKTLERTSPPDNAVRDEQGIEQYIDITCPDCRGLSAGCGRCRGLGTISVMKDSVDSEPFRQ